MGGNERVDGLSDAPILSLVSEEFFRNKISQALRDTTTTIEHRFCDSMHDVERIWNDKVPTLLFVDLEHPHALQALRRFKQHVVAFGPYMQDELRAIAKTFGATVYARSEFFDQLQQHVYFYEP
jgi:hypothetical protein